MQLMKDSLGKPTSVWVDTTPTTHYPSLAGDFKTDVVVVGGGLAGLMCAYDLQKAGLKVAVLEAGRLGLGTSGFTTAKITSAHGLIYRYLLDRFGFKLAKIYATANQTAIEEYAKIVSDLNINCDFERVSAYTCAIDSRGDDLIKQELEAAKSLDLPVAITNKVPLPYTATSAIEYANQAKFHPRKFLLRIAEEVNQGESFVFEKTRVLDIQEKGVCMVKTNRGTVTAQKVIVATNFPAYDPLNFYAQMSARQSYVIGVNLSESFSSGVFYSLEKKKFHSLRTQALSPSEEVLIVGGKLNDGDLPEASQYEHLTDWSKKNLPLGPVKYHWTTTDSESYDRVPLIGPLTLGSKKIFVVTGFSGWGMTHSVIAGLILSQEVQGKPHPWSALYSPKRFKNFKISQTPTKHLLHPNIAVQIKTGESKILNLDGQKAAVYKNEKGRVFAVSAVCTHMGCTVGWNNKEKTWDCPCHGSRYKPDGEVIHGPAVKRLPNLSKIAKVK